MDAESYINKVEDINIKRALQILSANFRRLSGRLSPIEGALGADPASLGTDPVIFYQTVKDDATPRPQRSAISFSNFKLVIDDLANDHTSVVQAYGEMADEGTPVAQEPLLDFVGAGVSLTPALGKTIVNITGVPAAHAPSHEAGGSDIVAAGEIRTTTGPTDLVVGAVADGEFLRRVGATLVGASPGASSVSFTEVEIDLGSTPRYNGKVSFFQAPTHIVGDPVLIFQAKGPYTGKGNLEDEAEMDAILATGWVKVVGGITEEIEVFWWSRYPVIGNFKFNYIVG